ncbi:TetR/AcrR family transcriptional regulator [Rhodococcus triatomae]|nr:TetR/AcrR family transcriptional regulator [Rhodococcus triatomae]QNG25686.1 TetR/AcrR family transcriptional regulator [Rhodococcus triatomae]
MERIVGAAVDLADREGMDAVSMRKVAEELGSGTMSLYRHVPTKDALVVAMVDAVTEEYAYPDSPEPNWRESLQILGRRDWDMYAAHPWMAEATTKPVASPAMVRSMEWALDAIAELELPLEDAASAILTVSTYVQGSARIALAVPAGTDIGAAWNETMKGVPLTGRPMLSELTRQLASLDAETMMLSGLDMVLDGIAARAARRGRLADGP